MTGNNSTNSYANTIGEAIDDIVTGRLKSFDRRFTNGASVPLETVLLGDINSLQYQTARFARRLNCLRSPILCLPAEVFQIIIRIVAEPHDERNIPYKPQFWIRLSHVSHDFRAMLLEMHSLWACVAFLPGRVPIEIREALLDRSQSAPFVIDFDRVDSIACRDLAIEHLVKARELYASSNSDAMDLLERKLQTGSYPVLEILNLRKYPPSTSTHEVCHNVSAPSLRHLILAGVSLRFDPQHLTELSLRSVPLAFLQSWSSSDFFAMLASCVNVEVLALVDAIPDLQLQTQKGPERRIALPALRELELDSSRQRVLDLWRSLLIPASATLDIQWDYHKLASPVALANLSTNIESLRNFAAFKLAYDAEDTPISGLQIQGLSKQSAGRHWMMFSLFAPYGGNADPFGDRDYYGLALFEVFRWTIYMSEWTEAELLKAIGHFCDIFQLTGIESLILDVQLEELFPKGERSQSIYTLFPNIRHLAFECFEDTASEMYLPLSRPPPSNHLPATLLYPNLHTLSLSLDNDLPREHRKRLGEVLQARSEAGLQVQCLIFTSGLAAIHGRSESLKNHVRELRIL
ncbi:hypothetical protein PENSPDRAFT_748820 [Peniophora sp. CONT]|nr:hypothetical protein PENSPDRAFT_748820 [Peniophora sp. CONT]